MLCSWKKNTFARLFEVYLNRRDQIERTSGVMKPQCQQCAELQGVQGLQPSTVTAFNKAGRVQIKKEEGFTNLKCFRR